MKDEYTKDLTEKLRGILIWVLQIAPTLAAGNNEWQDGRIPITGSSTSRRCKGLRSSVQDGATSSKVQSHVFYCTLIAWYVMHNAGLICDSKEVKDEIWKRLRDLAGINNTDNGANTVASEDALGCVLRWFHSHSIARISEALRKEDPGRFEALHIKIEEHQTNSDAWRAKAAKGARLYGQGRFARQSISHEIANIASLCDEIDAKDESTVASGLSCLSYVKELVQARQETEKVESGAPSVERWDASHTMISAMPRPAPWELSCLGHHLPGVYQSTQIQTFPPSLATRGCIGSHRRACTCRCHRGIKVTNMNICNSEP